MEKGYRTIEPVSLNPLFVKEKYFPFAVAIFHWLIPELQAKLPNELQSVDVEVIAGGYLGLYPVLGISYEDAETNDDSSLEELVSNTIEQILREKSVAELVQFIVKDEIDWSVKTKAILDEWKYPKSK